MEKSLLTLPVGVVQGGRAGTGTEIGEEIEEVVAGGAENAVARESDHAGEGLAEEERNMTRRARRTGEERLKRTEEGGAGHEFEGRRENENGVRVEEEERRVVGTKPQEQRGENQHEAGVVMPPERMETVLGVGMREIEW